MGGVPSNSGLARTLARLLSWLLPRVLVGLLSLLIWLALATTLLRLAFVILIHSILQKLLKYHLNEHHSNNDRTW